MMNPMRIQESMKLKLDKLILTMVLELLELEPKILPRNNSNQDSSSKKHCPVPKWSAMLPLDLDASQMENLSDQ